MNAMEQSSPTTLSLAKIRPGDNPRRYFDRKKHDELVASFRVRGMLQPMLVRPERNAEDTFSIIAGGRRYRAALEAFGPNGDVPVVIREMTDQEALEAAIDENDNRADASETEQADAAVRVLAACGGDRAEAARRLAWPPSKLDRRLALANLSDAVKLALDERRIKVGHAELLAVVPGDKQDKALDTILSAGLDVAKTRELLMRVTQSLASAGFDKTECTTCPFNSATQRALFETHVDDGHCTNPGCYQLKTETAAPAPIEEKVLVPAAAESAATPSPAKKGAPPTSTASPTAKPAPVAPQPPVTTKAILHRVLDLREAAWRKALFGTVDRDPAFAAAFDAVFRNTWQVDAEFLGRFGKDELKFIAQECGLVEHMGEKAFAKLLGSTVPGIIAGMIHAKGFSWAGRLPGAMTLDGKYGPPPAGAVPSAQAKD